MTMPKAYEPQHGYRYQILSMYKDSREYDHLDYAVDREDLRHLLGEYRLGMKFDYKFKTILLPKKYWKPLEGQVV